MKHVRPLVLSLIVTFITTTNLYAQTPQWCTPNIQNTHIGDDNANTYTGTSLNDFIQGLGGNDRLFGGPGDDCINGNMNQDTIFGDEGQDILHGGSDNDTMHGGRGNDFLYGDAGDDHMNGNEDHDTLFGGDGRDDMRGGKGNDNLYGEDGDDVLSGSCGTDYMEGGPGNDRYVYRRGDGNDTIQDSGSIIVDLVNFNSGEYRDVFEGNDRVLYFDQTTSGSLRIKNGRNYSVTIRPDQNGITTVQSTGGPITLTAMAGTKYRWLHSNETTRSVVVSPSSTTTYSVEVTNTWGCSNTDRYKVQVTLPCNPSIGGTPPTSVDENTPYSFTPTANTCGSATFSITNQPLWAQFNTTNGTLSGTPGPEHAGITHNIVITMTTSSGTVSLTAFDLEVIHTPQAPVAVDDQAQTDEDVAVTIPVLANDSDPDNDLDPTSLTVITQPANGQVSINASGALVYTPQPDYNGSDSLEYRVCDLTGLCDTATVTLEITAQNDPPVITPVQIPDTVNEGATVLLDILAEDPEGGPVSLSLWENDQIFDDEAPLEWKAPGVSAATAYDLVILAQDQDGAVTSLPITLTVNDLYASPLEVCSSCEFTTLQDAVCAAAPGETVRILEPVLTEADVRVFGANNLTIEGLGPDQTTVQASSNPGDENPLLTVSQFFNRPNSGLTLRNMTLRHGSTLLDDTDGAVIENCVFQDTTSQNGALEIHGGSTEITESIITGNTGQWTGGLALFEGDLEIRQSTIHQNQALAADSTGGLLSQFGFVTVTASTFSNNQGGLTGGLQLNDGMGLLHNSTISGNTGQVGGVGASDGFLELIHNTIAFNQGAGLSADEMASGSGNILFGNTGGDCLNGDLSDTPNLVGDGSCNGVIGDPALQPLAHNGGPTQTHLPGEDGDALDAAGPNCFEGDGPFVSGQDQRGLPRPVGDCDLGSVELQENDMGPVLPPILMAATAVEGGEIRDNALVDSYSSCNGAYGGANTGQEGHVQAGGNLQIFPNANITGSATPHASVTAEPIPVPQGLPQLGNLNLSGNQPLMEGDYYHHNITIFGGTDLQTTGPVRIWFSGRLDIQSGTEVRGAGDNPALLQFLSAGGSDPVTMQSNSELTGIIYAPERHVDIQSNAQLYGALTAKSFLLMGNSKVHFDEALLSGPCPEPEPVDPNAVPPVLAAIDAAGDEAVIMDNARVDSYDSSLGGYGGSNVGSQGDVQAAGAVNTFPNAQIQGEIKAHTPSGATSPPPPEGLTPNGDLNVNGSLSLPAGDYYFNNINLAGNSWLSFQGGRARIWFVGSLNVGSGAIVEATSGKPGDIRFFDTDGNGKVDLQSNAILFAVIHTPGLPVILQSNVYVFGGVTGYKVTLHGNASVHRDMSLQP